MEDGTRKIGSGQYFAAGVRLMQAAGGYDMKTRKALERLSVVYFTRAIERVGSERGTPCHQGVEGVRQIRAPTFTKGG